MHDDPPDPRDVGDRIERLLDDLHSRLDPRAYGAVEDLVRLRDRPRLRRPLLDGVELVES